MTDASTPAPADRTEERDLRDDAGNPSTDRSYLADEPPTQVNEEAVRDHTETDTDESGSDADAARD